MVIDVAAVGQDRDKSVRRSAIDAIGRYVKSCAKKSWKKKLGQERKVSELTLTAKQVATKIFKSLLWIFFEFRKNKNKEKLDDL